MTNFELANIFGELVELLEVKSENPFKIRAYYKAVQVIENYPIELENIYTKDGIAGLEEISGIGKGIAQKIEELIKTGKLVQLDELKKSMPSGILEILKIQGMGPKKTKLVYDKLKVSDIQELEKVAKEGKLRNLPGMGEKTEQNILKGIEFRKKAKERMPLSKALPIANLIINDLKKLKEIDKIGVAGSVRRGRETIKDIDILVTSKFSEKVMKAFTNLTYVEQVLTFGNTKSSVVTKEGIQVDLRVVENESYGASLCYFTGSKEHNIKLRELAIKAGLKINEYGVFKINIDKKIVGKTEEEIYDILKLKYIPPELREDRGEIEAARNGELPVLVREKDIKGDLQVHSEWSDGADKIEEIVEVAKKRGYEYIAITDHSKSLRIANGLTAERLKEQIKIIKRLNEKLAPFKILTGTEVDIKPDGTLDFDEKMLKELDVVVASVHTKFTQDKDEMTKRIIKAIQNKYVNIIGHLSGRIIGQRPSYLMDFEKILNEAKNTGTFLEINSHPDRLDITDIQAHLAKDNGMLIPINTDAHHKLSLADISFGIITARRGWLEKKDVLNALPYKELITKLHQKRE